MKSERRHELQQNSLIQAVYDLPAFARRHGSRIAIVVIAISLLIIWLKYRSNSAAQRLEDARLNLTEAMVSLRQLENLSVVPPGQEEGAAQQRSLWYTDGLQHCDTALDEAGGTDPALRAQALLYKGDLNFALADMPDLPGSATRPSLKPELGTLELLSNAQAPIPRCFRIIQIIHTRRPRRVSDWRLSRRIRPSRARRPIRRSGMSPSSNIKRLSTIRTLRRHTRITPIPVWN